MKQRDIGSMRLAAQHMTSDLFDTPEAVVRHLLAMQAQDYNGALWSIGLRTKQSTRYDVEQAIRDRKIVRTWPMRGTLHFLHADDVHWMVALLAGRATAAAKSRRIKQLGLTDAVVDEAERALRNALHGGKSILRGDVVGLLHDKVKGIEITNQHTQHLMRNFGERGIICFGPYEGKQPTFVLLDEWIPKPVEKPRSEALHELALRYFVSHGPATLKDFSGWGMMTMTDAKAGLAAAEAQLDQATIDATTYYFARNLAHAPTHDALLLPGFDEYLLGYKDRSAVLDLAHAQKVVPGNNGMFLPTVVQDGQVVGLWQRKHTAKAVTFTYNGFAGELAAKVSEQRYRQFISAVS